MAARAKGGEIGKRIVLGLVGLASLARAAHAEDFVESRRIEGDHLTFANLVGDVAVESHRGSAFEVSIAAHGRDATREHLAIREAQGPTSELSVSFTSQGDRRFSYPPLRRSTTVQFTAPWLEPSVERSGDGVLRKSRGRTIIVSGGRRGLEAWTDVVIKVPEGKALTLRTGVGNVTVIGLNGAVAMRGERGDARVERVTGSVEVENGSGDVVIVGVNGETSAQTGSGDVEITQSSGPRLKVESGSGRVSGANLTFDRLTLESGNGRIHAAEVSGSDVHVETGNGSIELTLGSVAKGSYSAETGNGGIVLGLPPNASAEVDAETGYGSVRLDLDEKGLDILKRARDHVHFRVGGGDAQVRLESGHGRIRISR